jgi:hypothetical protein
MSTQPRYVNNSAIARYMGVHHVTVIGWRKNFPPDHQRIPTPAPVAFVLEQFGAETPLWLPEQLNEWAAWSVLHKEYAEVNRRVRMGQARAARAV